MRPSTAFTLTEVAIALALITLAVSSAMLLFPIGLKAQQLARFGLYAAMKAEEIAELAAAAPNDNTNIDSEAFQPWDVPIGYRVLTPDIEARVASPPYGIMPLPLAIARRIDSDGDEIAGVLDSGAQLYYSQATPVGQLREDVIREVVDTPPSDVQRMVFAVIGSPQQNAIFSFPWKAWPYYAHYPSPPMHGAFLPGQYPAQNAFEFTWPLIDRNALFEGAVPSRGIADGVDADIRVVFEHHEHDLRYGYKPYAYDPDGGAPTRDGAVRYVQATLWYCIRKGLPKAYWDPSSTTPLTVFDATVPRWQQVDATRFLAHATACMTRWCDLAELGGQPSTDAAGFPIPSVTLAGVTVPALRLTHDEIVFHHETCLNLAMRYAAEDPYDWGAPRPIQRAIMTDYPLMQWDLFSPPLRGNLFDTGEGVGAVPAEQWRPLAGRRPTNLGVSWTFPDRSIGPVDHGDPAQGEIWGDPAHFTLTAPFDPCERCRELVFWAVDWLAYEDAEMSPSAPVDASRWNIAARLRGQGFDRRMTWNDWWEMHLRDSRNPERHLTFVRDISARATGAPIADVLMGYYGQGDRDDARIFCGVHGADRNANGVLDRGPVPASTRMRAVRVARFNLYDPRVPAVLR